VARIAIVGTGISGMGCAHFLHRTHDLTIFEKNRSVGGHTNTVTVDEAGVPVPIDTGFMVFNRVTYPNLMRLFGDLEVPIAPTSMSFSVQHVPSGLEFSGSSLNHLFAQRKNLVNPRFIRMLFQIDRFNRECLEVLNNPKFRSYTLAQYCLEKNFGEDVLHRYLVPMSSAVWSTPPDAMLRFPAATLIRFFKNHGFLGLSTQHQWYTIPGGSQVYRDKLIAPFRDRIVLGDGVVRVSRTSGGVVVTTASGQRATFDKVILACHADEALAILEHPTQREAALLVEFPYQLNHATLHTDESVMPKTRLAWSSWNYRIDQDADGTLEPSTVYWMNSLQNVSQRKNYFVSINGARQVRGDAVLKSIEYTHPVFTLGSARAQRELPELNREGPVYFCGAWFRYGFHEDGFTSALDLTRSLTGEQVWPGAPGLSA
jgi:predicted NAD/FAD-binding protein